MKKYGVVHIQRLENLLVQRDMEHRTNSSRSARNKVATTRKRQGYIFFENYPKQSGDKRSCLQDAVVNAAHQLKVPMDVHAFMQACPPKTKVDTRIQDVFDAAAKFLEFEKDNLIFAMKGGTKANLLATKDGKVRLVCSKVTNRKITTKHAFIHCAYKLEGVNKEHVGAIIDNREEEPICLIEPEDFKTAENARQTITNFFGGKNTRVFIESIYKVEPIKNKGQNFTPVVGNPTTSI